MCVEIPKPEPDFHTAVAAEERLAQIEAQIDGSMANRLRSVERRYEHHSRHQTTVEYGEGPDDVTLTIADIPEKKLHGAGSLLGNGARLAWYRNNISMAGQRDLPQLEYDENILVTLDLIEATKAEESREVPPSEEVRLHELLFGPPDEPLARHEVSYDEVLFSADTRRQTLAERADSGAAAVNILLEESPVLDAVTADQQELDLFDDLVENSESVNMVVPTMKKRNRWSRFKNAAKEAIQNTRESVRSVSHKQLAGAALGVAALTGLGISQAPETQTEQTPSQNTVSEVATPATPAEAPPITMLSPEASEAFNNYFACNVEFGDDCHDVIRVASQQK